MDAELIVRLLLPVGHHLLVEVEAAHLLAVDHVLGHLLALDEHTAEVGNQCGTSLVIFATFREDEVGTFEAYVNF